MIPKVNSIAVLITCFNRKDRTLDCIKHLFESKYSCTRQFEMDVYLTDDGSLDGTGPAIREKFPVVIILSGNGNLYWAGGMRNSWKEALKKNHDAYLLLNDDTIINNICFDELFKTHDFSIKKYGKAGIYIGSVRDPITLEHTYGGSLLLNKWSFATQKILPAGEIKECHMACANIMFVHCKVLEAIGILNEKYIHAKADYDYTLRAREKGFPVLVCSNYCGYCSRDHGMPNLTKMNLKERIKYLKSPKGIELSGYLYLMGRFFPWRAPFVCFSLWLKTLIPGFSKIIDRIMFR